MSNQAVGPLYQNVIEEVIASSRVDFEENGIEESVLEELRQGWQQKLSQLDVARFPWDPKPDPPAQPQQQSQSQQPTQQTQQTQPQQTQQQPSQPPQPAASTHSQATFSPQPPHQPSPAPAATAQNGIKPDPDAETNVPIKQEAPGPGHISMPPPMSFGGGDAGKNNVAANRAAQLVQQQYGERAVGSINAIQQGHQTQGQQQPADPQQAYRQQMAAATAQQQSEANGQGRPHPSQTDGAFDADSDVDEDNDDDDFEAVILRKSNGNIQELGRVEIDRLMHDRIASQAKAMEGGGLMVPLKEATRHKTSRNPDRKGKGKAVAQHDGGDEDDENDEDAINSDLDDPDDGGSEDEVDDEGLGHIMLCMYDKVQRVKNKWKCTLKDGVLTVDGKEYIFHKATGEYEW